MKKLLLFVSLSLAHFSMGQTFHFEDTCTTLIKNTNQSPAHWYLEIFNDVGVDTTLRWKAAFENIPVEWSINFDSQSQNWPMVMDGDSADFTLLFSPDFPQKLIIGAMLNGTPGHGTVFFDIFDPDFPSYRQSICYEFIVSAVGLDELQSVPFVRFKGDVIEVINGKETTVDIYAINGQHLLHQTGNTQFILNGLSTQPVLIYLKQDDKQYVVRTLLQ